jgi:hypothetical protein
MLNHEQNWSFLLQSQRVSIVSRAHHSGLASCSTQLIDVLCNEQWYAPYLVFAQTWAYLHKCSPYWVRSILLILFTIFNLASKVQFLVSWLVFVPARPTTATGKVYNPQVSAEYMLIDAYKGRKLWSTIALASRQVCLLPWPSVFADLCLSSSHKSFGSMSLTNVNKMPQSPLSQMKK